MSRLLLYTIGVTAAQGVVEHVTEDVHLQVYAPFAQLGALAVFALLMFLFMQRVVSRTMSQSAAREIAERNSRQATDQRLLDQLERIGTILDNHLTTLYGLANATLENQRASYTAIIEHDRIERETWSKVLDRFDRLTVK